MNESEMLSRNKTITPIFVFSLPRSGSTLLQRLLATHSEIATTSEPWILLPLVYSNKPTGVFAEYWHRHATLGSEDYFQQFDNGIDVYKDALGALVLELYALHVKDSHVYFLDKTPRYHLIAEEIMEMFPEAKAIILWRNPLSIISSIIKSWLNNRFNIHRFQIDFYDGIDNLCNLNTNHSDRLITIRYEDLVENPTDSLRTISEYLDLPYSSELANKFSEVSLQGRMGDKTGIQKYRTISKDSLDSWKTTFAYPFRIFWCKRYIRAIGKEKLTMMGYEQEDLLKQISAIKYVSFSILPDLFDCISGYFKNRILARLLRSA